MQRLALSLRASIRPIVSSEPGAGPRSLPIRILRPSAAPFSSTRWRGTKSAPKSAEGPSADSGGSRSKSAVEAGAGSSSSPSSSSSSSTSYSGSPTETMPDGLAERDARGKTGGGSPLETSAPGAPAQPKISNMSVPGGKAENLTEEQKREVEEHNREFDKRHDRASAAAGDKVDKRFWEGGGERGKS